MRGFHSRYILRRTFSDNSTTTRSGFRSHINNPISAFHHVGIMLHDNQRMTAPDQFFFTAGKGKVLEELPPGPVSAVVTYRKLSENESTFIPLGHVHRLTNPGKVPLEIIEVQSGSYLGEDDIVRFEDTYGRTAPAAAPAHKD